MTAKREEVIRLGGEKLKEIETKNYKTACVKWNKKWKAGKYKWKKTMAELKRCDLWRAGKYSTKCTRCDNAVGIDVYYIKHTYCYSGFLGKTHSVNRDLACEVCYKREYNTPQGIVLCKSCGTNIHNPGMYRYCSDYCRNEAEKINVKQKQEVKRVNRKRICISCEEEYTPPRNDADFCSNKCRQADYRKRKKASKTKN